MSEQIESTQGDHKEPERCGKPVGYEKNLPCVVKKLEDCFVHVCASIHFWCTVHESARLARDEPCPKCYSASIAKLEKDVAILDEHYSLAEHLSSDVDDLQSDIKVLREIVQKRTERIAEEEILIRSLEPWVSVREIVRIVCTAPVVLAGYVASIQGSAALDLGLLKVDLGEHILGDILKALDRLESERIAQVRAEHRKAAEYLRLAPMFLSRWASVKRKFAREGAK